MAVEEYLPPVVTRLAMNLDDFRNGVAQAKALIKTLDSRVTVNVNVDAEQAARDLATIATAVHALDGRNVKIGVNAGNIAGQAAAFTLLRGNIDAVNGGITSMSRRLSANTDAWRRWAITTSEWVDAATADMTAAFHRLDAAASSFHPNTVLALNATALMANAQATMAAENGARAQAALINAQANMLRAQTAQARTANSSNGTRPSIFGYRPYGIWGAALSASRAPIPLFAGALGRLVPALDTSDNKLVKFASHLVSMTAGWHLAAEAVIEFTAVWGPALLALTAYGLAAAPTVKDIATQLVNMQTAATATGRSFDSLATKGESVTKAVRPSVLEAFGIGLYTIQRDSGTLAPILSNLGVSIDQIVARASAALVGTGSIWATGAKDAGMLLTAFGDLFGILGNLTKAVPGYAEVLLQFGTDVLGVAERITGSLSGVLGIFLKLHGAIFYGGLFGTASAWGFSKIVSGITSITEAVAGLAVALGVAEPIIAGLGRGLLVLDLLSSPAVLAGIGLVAGGIAALVMYLRSGKTSAQEFGASIQQSLANASMGQLQSLLKSDTATNAQRLAAAQNNLAKAQQNLNAAAARNTYPARGNVLAGQQDAVRQAQREVDGYVANNAQLASQQQNLHSNLAAVAKDFGISLPDALAIAGKAQVSTNQLLGSGANNLAQIEALVGGYIAQVKVMAVGTGTLNSALNALNVTTSQQYQDIQDVTGAYSTWIGIVTGGDSAFATFEQGQKTLITDLKSGGETVHTTLGKISDKFTTVKSSLNGTSDSSLAARQAFDSQTQAAISLYNAMATQAAVAGNSPVAQNALLQGGKDIVASLLPLARGSAEATAEVGALAELVGGPAGADFAKLAKWVGNTKNVESDLNKQQAILTITTANLSQAAKNLASGLQGAVTQAMVNAIANTANLDGVTQNLANSLNKSHGKITSSVQKMANEYVKSLQKLGIPDKQIAGALDALARSYGVNASAAEKWANQTVAQVDKVKAAMDNVHSKTVSLSVVTSGALFNVPGTPLGNVHPGVSSPAALAAAASASKAPPPSRSALKGFASGTSGASSGWAWVGEAGPELVRFRGGEQVIPSHIARGYANGTSYGDTTHQVNVYLDGKQIYQAVQKESVNTQRRTGTNGLSRRFR
jgi:hypothetical protein